MATNDSIVRALGWVLAHSLWQGTLAALLLLLLLPRLSSARQRYWTAYGLLTSVFIAAFCTFFLCYEPGVEGAASVFSDAGSNLAFFYDVEQAGSSWQAFTLWLEENNALIVAFWLLGFAFFLLRLGGGMWQIHRLRTQRIHTPGDAWLEKFRVLQSRLGLNGAVVLMESALVHTPLALGWLKPVVLLPVGLVNRLSVAEVEAVLAHELAHIARRDWVFNLVQAFIESLFYYHPALWWISSVVRRERENCCDDAALAATGNPLAFAKALVQVQEMAVPVPALALGLSGPRRRPLLERVKRILNQPQQQHHQVMEKITATVVLLALLALVGLRANSVPTLQAAFDQITEIPATLFGEADDQQLTETDTLPKPKSTTHKITREDGDERVEAEYKDGQLIRLNIDGKEIPESEFEEHEALIESIEEDLPVPPTPPTPPSPADIWVFPPGAPAAPHGYGFYYGTPSPAAPIAPMPPIPGGPIKVITDKDGSGNTIIKLDNNGKATEVVVKNGEVFVDGKKIEKGEAVEIPGVYFKRDGQFYFPEGAHGFGFNFDGDHDVAVWAPSADEMRAMELSHEDMARALEESHRAMEENHELLERELRAARIEAEKGQKDWKKQQKEWTKDQKRFMKEQKEWQKEQEKWQKEQEKWQVEQKAWEEKSRAMQDALKKELLKDGLINNANTFNLQLNARELIVNKKKQSEELRKKYAELIEKFSGNKIGKDESFNFNFLDDN